MKRNQGNATSYLPNPKCREIYEEEPEESWDEYIISTTVFFEEEYIHVHFASGDRVNVPFDWFEPNPVSEPDFSDVRPIDYGQTLKLGDFEVESDTIKKSFLNDISPKEYRQARNSVVFALLTSLTVGAFAAFSQKWMLVLAMGMITITLFGFLLGLLRTQR